MASRAKTNGVRAIESNHLVIKGAREHNLQIEHLNLPKRRFIVFTGVSGSGKSSLAFDTIFAEGQRRYVESLSAYARQFLGQMDKPLFDHISGLSPTIAIEQKAASGNPRSTVGTITEIADYLRVLYARVGVQHCHQCGQQVAAMSPDEIVKLVRRDYRDRKVLLLAPLLLERKGEHRELLSEALGRGFVRARVDGRIQRLDAVAPLDKKRKHTIELVVDRLTVKATTTRLTDSVETALTEGEGTLIVAPVDGDNPERHLSEHRFCADCGIAFPELTPQSFSFNTPLGMCTECNGLGRRLQIDPELVVPDPSLSIREGAIAPFASIMERESGWTFQIVDAMVHHYGIDLDKPWKRLPKRHRHLMLYGSGDDRVRVAFEHSHGQIDWDMHYEGIINTLMRRYQQTQSEAMRRHYLGYFAEGSCTSCHGSRLRSESRAVRVADVTIDAVSAMTIAQAAAHFAALKVMGARVEVATELVKELSARLGFLMDVGLDYLTLDRSGPTLSAAPWSTTGRPSSGRTTWWTSARARASRAARWCSRARSRLACAAPNPSPGATSAARSASGCRPAGARRTASSRSTARRATTCATLTSPFPWGCFAWSPACPARARAPW
jgi:excinuclease ABC subunit A